jgi:predicted DNA-binding mobile mystery protein A
MSPDSRKMARQNLDRRFASIGNIDDFARPSRGWIKAIREALGMTAAQFGQRLGVSQPRALAIEQAEARNAITLDTLERSAQALGCRLVYTLVPHEPLEAMVKNQSLAAAKKQLERTRHTMALEAQSLERADDRDMLLRLARALTEKSGSKIWEEE